MRESGFAVTPSDRYAALRAAAIGSYGFDAAVIPLASDDHSTLASVIELFATKRVALLVEKDWQSTLPVPHHFSIIYKQDWRTQKFPIDWLSAAPQASTETVQILRADSDAEEQGVVSLPAQRRLLSLARRARQELAAPADSPQFDMLALLEDEIAWAKMSDTPFALLLAHVASREIHPILSDVLRKSVRSSDAVGEHAHNLYALLSGTSSEQAEAIIERLRRLLARVAKRSTKPKRLAKDLQRTSIGFACYPEHGTSREALLARATAAAQPIVAPHQ